MVLGQGDLDSEDLYFLFLVLTVFSLLMKQIPFVEEATSMALTSSNLFPECFC